MSELCHSATHVKREPGLWSKTNNILSVSARLKGRRTRGKKNQ